MSITTTPTAEDYILDRDLPGSVRLIAQYHAFNKIAGYVLHPKIPIRPGMRIADLATGTAIWPLELSSQLPETVELHGFDVSAEQFPHQELCPPNLSLHVSNLFDDVPDEYRAKFDVVHLRLVCSLVRNNDPSQIIRHAMQMLRPGGYLQWEEGHTDETKGIGDKMEKVLEIMKPMFTAINFMNGWLDSLPTTLQHHGMIPLDGAIIECPKWLRHAFATSHLAAQYEIVKTAKKIHDPSVASYEEQVHALDEAVDAMKSGQLFFWSLSTALAQMPERARL